MDSTQKNNTVPAHIQRRQARELDEQRILGLAPLAVDSVTGNTISPHVPTMLSTAPWYRKDLHKLDNSCKEGSLTIAHHLKKEDPSECMGDEPLMPFERVESFSSSSQSALLPTYAPGSCRNCGGTTHRTEQCLKPKKKLGGSLTVPPVEGVYVLKSDVIHQTTQNLSFEQKKSGWSRMSSKNYEDTWEASEKRVREREAATIGSKVSRSEGQSLFEARTAAEGLKVANHDVSTTPKYLENLDDDTFYDPRTRSMRGNPNALKKADPSAATTVYRGDNAVLHTEGYFDFLDSQARYIAGESKSFVDVVESTAERDATIYKKAVSLAKKLIKSLGNELASDGALLYNIDERVAINALYDIPMKETTGHSTALKVHPADTLESTDDDYFPV